MNRWGIHWANVPIDDNLTNMALSMGGDNYVVIDGAWGAVKKIRDARPNATIVHRHCVPNWMDVEPEDYAKQLADLFRQHQQYTEHIMLENEQDIYPNFPGWDKIEDRLRFAASWNVVVANYLTELCPTATIHTPALAHERIDLPQWFEIWKPVMDVCDVLDMHCYWEKGGKFYRDGLYHPEDSLFHAFRYRTVHNFLEQRGYWIPTFISECGNFAPDMPDYADQLIYYFRGIEEDADYMIGACPFILKSDKYNYENDMTRQPNLPEFFKRLGEATKKDLPYPRRPTVRTDLPQSTDVKLSIELTDLRESIERHPILVYPRRSISSIDTIVIHHTATKTASPEAIARYHARTLNWPGAGYHLLVRLDGSIYWINSLEVVSNQTSGHNAHTIGIGFEGSFIDGALPTDAQYQSGKNLVAAIHSAIGRLPLRGHKQMPGAQTACPGDLDIGRLFPNNNLKLELAKDTLHELSQIIKETLAELEE